MASIELCDAQALQPFVGCLESRGIDTERYLERQHLSPEFVARGEGKFFKRQAWTFFADVVAREKIPSLGFLDGDNFDVTHLGPLQGPLLEAVTLKDAIDTFSQLVAIYAEGNTITMQVGAESTWLTCRTDHLDADAFVPDDFTVVVLTSLIRIVAGPDWQPGGLRFQTADSKLRSRATPFRDIECSYSQYGSAIAFPSEFLARSLPVDKDPTEAEDISTPLRGTTAESLRTVLESIHPTRPLPTSEQASEILGVSRRTLSRALNSEGISYRRLVDRVRFESAVQRLRESNDDIGTIARDIGYSGANNFVRAFKRISGQTPSEYRIRHS